MYNFFFLSLYCSLILRTTSYACVVSLPGIKPNWIKSIFWNFQILLSSIFSTVFVAYSNSFTPLQVQQFLTSPFPLKIGTSTLVCHLSGIPFPRNTRWQSSTITLTPYYSTSRYYFCTYFRGSSCLSWFHHFYCYRHYFAGNIFD